MEPQRRIEKFWRVEKSIAVQAAESGEFRVGEPRNGPQDTRLLAMLQLGLEAHHVEQRAELVVLTQLYDRIRLCGWLSRIGQAERLHRAMAQRFPSALGHHFDRQAAFEVGRRGFEVVESRLVPRDQRIDEVVVL